VRGLSSLTWNTTFFGPAWARAPEPVVPQAPSAAVRIAAPSASISLRCILSSPRRPRQPDGPSDPRVPDAPAARFIPVGRRIPHSGTRLAWTGRRWNTLAIPRVYRIHGPSQPAVRARPAAPTTRALAPGAVSGRVRVVP